MIEQWLAAVRRTSFVLVAFACPESEVAPARTASHYVISMTDAGRTSPYRHWTNASKEGVGSCVVDLTDLADLT